MRLTAFLPALALVASLTAAAVAQVPNPTSGPDVTVHDITDVGAYGHGATTNTAFAVGTNACNVGTTPVTWIQNGVQHPVIAQNMYRYFNGSFQQIGQSWLKHGYASTNSAGCGSCIGPPQGGNQLGVGCTDAYGSGLNGNQSLLGPRSEVNPHTGAFIWPHSLPTGDATTKGRLLVADADLANAAARYFVDAHYVTADDAVYGNGNNNSSWQEISVPTVNQSGGVGLLGSPHWTEQGIMAWKAIDPYVNVVQTDIVGDGRITTAARGTPLGNGLFHYEYNIENMNADRCVQAVTVGLPAGAIVSNVAFHAPFSHSGEAYSNVPWSNTMTVAGLQWFTDTYASNVNANAIRWGTMYNFSFDSASTPGNVTLNLFKPGSPSSVTVAITASTCVIQPTVPSSNNGYVSNASAAYDFIDISATGSAGPVGDDNASTVNLGFTFPFYGVTTTQILIGTNGYLCLPGHSGTVYSNTGIPNAGEPNGIIAAYWDDLYALSAGSGGGSIKYQTTGIAPNRRFVVEWVGIWHYGQTATSAETFEAILDETTGKITTTIVATNAVAGVGGGASATRGIEAPDGLSGIQTSVNTVGSAVAGTSVTYTRTTTIPPSCVLQLTGSGAPNTLLTLTLYGVVNAPVDLVIDFSPGPTNLGPTLGMLNVGFPPAIVIADGFGVFGVPDGSATNACGVYSWSYLVPPGGVVSGFTAYGQGVILNALAPNSYFDISTPVTFVAP